MAVAVTLGEQCGVDPRRLAELADLVASASARPLAPDRPVTGRGVFRHESGIHVRGLLADPSTYEPFSPETIGRPPSEIVLGKHSGTAAIRHVLAKQGVQLDRAQAERLLSGLRSSRAWPPRAPLAPPVPCPDLTEVTPSGRP